MLDYEEFSLLYPPVVVKTNKPRYLEYSYESNPQVIKYLEMWRIYNLSFGIISIEAAADKRKIMRRLDDAIYYGIVHGG